MDKQYSKQFFSSLVLAIQEVCKNYLDFDEIVEISGYVSVEIDNTQKERYVLGELIHASGNVLSESYCTKAFKTLKPFHRSMDDVVQNRQKRKRTDSLDCPMETLISQKHPCATTSGSDCSSAGYKNKPEVTPEDRMYSSSQSRESSTMTSNYKRQKDLEWNRSDLPPVLSPVKPLFSCTVKKFDNQRSATEAGSFVQQASDTNRCFMSELKHRRIDRFTSSDQGQGNSKSSQVEMFKESRTSVFSIHPNSNETDRDPGPKYSEAKDSSKQDEKAVISDQHVSTDPEMKTRWPNLKYARIRGTQSRCEQQASMFGILQNYNGDRHIDTNQPSCPLSSPLTVDTKQPQVSLCKISRLGTCHKDAQIKSNQLSDKSYLAQLLMPRYPPSLPGPGPGQGPEMSNDIQGNTEAGSEEGSQGELDEVSAQVKDSVSCHQERLPETPTLSSGSKIDLKFSDEGHKRNVKGNGGFSSGFEQTENECSPGTKTTVEVDESTPFMRSVPYKTSEPPFSVQNDRHRSCEDMKSYMGVKDDIDVRAEAELPDLNPDSHEDVKGDDVDVVDKTGDGVRSGGEEHFAVDLSLNSLLICSSTAKKTRFHMKLFSSHLNSVGETRPAHTIPCKLLDTYIGNFLATVKRDNGEDYLPSSLSSIQNSIERHLRKLNYPYSIKRDAEFLNSRTLLSARLKSLRVQATPAQRAKKVDLITEQEVDILYGKGQLGTSSAEALLNTVWFMNNIYFGLKYSVDHYNLKWGDLLLQVDEEGQEYLEMVNKSSESGDDRHRVYAKINQPEQCFVNVYKKYRSVRPEETCMPDAPFYLTVNRFHGGNQPWFKFQNAGVNFLGALMRRMASAAGLDKDRFTANAVVIKGD